MNQPLMTANTSQPLFDQIMHILSANVRSIVGRIPSSITSCIEEIRLRVGRPLSIDAGGTHFFVDERGVKLSDAHNAYMVTGEDMAQTLNLVTKSSLYALEEELRRGYITLSGGHRVGLAGRAMLDGNGKIRGMKEFGSLNIRIAKAITGSADPLRQALILPNGKVANALIISPPQCGKTTMLRDLARQLSNGTLSPLCPPQKVVIVDERSELAGCVAGLPQHDVGLCTDVLDACPKAEGITMMIRSMAPQVIITDEIGRIEDRDAIWEALYAGVSVITSAHGTDVTDVRKRIALGLLFDQGAFDRYIVLSRRTGPATIEGAFDGVGRRLTGALIVRAREGGSP